MGERPGGAGGGGDGAPRRKALAREAREAIGEERRLAVVITAVTGAAKRCAQPEMSRKRPSGGSSATSGV